MEASNTGFIATYEKARSLFSVWASIIVTILAVIVIFIIASLEGTREIRASNTDNGILLNMWRSQNNVVEGFPESYVSVIYFKDQSYYFVANDFSPENGEVLSWYWAYDGGLGYVFSDFKYYVLVAITFIFSVVVSLSNYNTTIEKVKSTDNFKKTLLYYQNIKDKISKYTQFLPDFCSFKTTEAYEEEKRNIVESANLNWDDYKNDKIDYNKVEKWQIKKLKKLRKLKVVKLKAKDLLYETNQTMGGSVRLLPLSQEEHKKFFIKTGVVTRLLTSALSGMVAGFGIILGNWVLGLIFGFSIILSAFLSVVTASDYGLNVLKNRYIGKAELLSEFDNVKENFFKKEDINLSSVTTTFPENI